MPWKKKGRKLEPYERSPKQEDIDARISAGLLLWYYQTPSLDWRNLTQQEILSLVEALRTSFSAYKGDIM
jgi:hypothetical protein